MDNLKNNRLLLSLLAILLTVKFIIVPVTNWQDDLVVENRAKELKIAKSDMLLNQEASFIEQSDVLKEQLEKLKRIFYDSQPDSEFKLTQQKIIEKLLKEHDLRSENFGWQASSELNEFSLKRFQLQIRFSGNIANLVAFISELEHQEQRYEVRNFNFNFSSGSSHFRGGRIVLNVYMHQNSENVKKVTIYRDYDIDALYELIG